MGSAASSQHELPVTKAEYVVRRLREDIHSGRISPGETIRHGELASEYGVSQTPVREAIRRLEAEGIIVTINGSSSVRSFSREAMEEIYRMRGRVEGLAVLVGARRLTAESLDRLEAMNEALRRAVEDGESPRRLSEMNRDFHFALYGYCSDVVVQEIRSLWQLFPPTATIWGAEETSTQLVEGHAEVLRALRDGNPEAASECMEQHVLRAWALRSSLENLSTSE
jgi:DNA-binding GntR family transcriptional regulator